MRVPFITVPAIAFLVSTCGNPDDLTLRSELQNESAVRKVPSILEFAPIAFNEETGRLSFWGAQPGKNKPKGLHWASADFSVGSFVDIVDNCAGEYPCADWSPDGRALAYEKKNQIYLFDVSSGSSKLLASGHDPTWSANGMWISFRALDGHASGVTMGGTPVSVPFNTHKILGPIRWPANGRYVIFPEQIPLHLPLIGAYYRLVVCRVSDGETITVREFGLGATDLRSFSLDTQLS
jgi:hypothetical protein